MQLLQFTANLKVKLIGMEACGGSHFLGRALQKQGHDIRLIPAQYVKPYVKTNKNDYIDAEAIAEAVGRPRMRFVPVKSEDQLDLQSLHRVRERWVMRRTAVVNQIRGLLLERGTTLRKGRRYVDEALPGILAGSSSKLSGAVLVLLAELKQELEQLAEKIDRSDKSIEKIARDNEACQRLVEDAWSWSCHSNRDHRDDRQRRGIRQRDAISPPGWEWFPRKHSTGGKQTLWKIPQRGNQYLRRLFVQGARAVMQHRTKQSSGLSAWLAQLTARTHQNIAIVALANKLARMAWAVLASNEAYRPPLLAGNTI